jgi:hypothetical protein
MVEEWYPRDGDGLDQIELADFRDEVVAIESEAREAYRAELRAALEAAWTAHGAISQAVVLRIIDETQP